MRDMKDNRELVAAHLSICLATKSARFFQLIGLILSLKMYLGWHQCVKEMIPERQMKYNH